MQYTYIMSDIHGHYSEFRKMLKQIEFDDSDTLYIIGDIMDRGRENLKMLNYVYLSSNIHLLMGNHEDLLLQAYRGESGIDRKYCEAVWISNGGDKTKEDLRKIKRKKLDEYLDYLETLPMYKFLYYNNQEYLLVHAGLLYTGGYKDKYELMENQKDNLLWIRDDYLANKKISELPFKIITGHTPTSYLFENGYPLELDQKRNSFNNKIVTWENKINIDCGCAFNRFLGCLRLDDMKEFYVKCKEFE